LSRTGYPVLMALSGMKQANAETEGANA